MSNYECGPIRYGGFRVRWVRYFARGKSSAKGFNGDVVERLPGGQSQLSDGHLVVREAHVDVAGGLNGVLVEVLM